MSRDIKFQRRHFEFIADIIARLNIPDEYVKRVEHDFERELTYTNPEFDSGKFRMRALAGHEGDDGRFSEILDDIRWIVRHEHGAEILASLWVHEPELMKTVVERLNHLKAGDA